MNGAAAGPVALVTGAARGIGVAICEALYNAGHRVVRADLLPRESWAAAPSVLDVELDVRSTTSCRQAITEVEDRLGRLDVLVNNAGVVARGMAIDVDDAVFNRILDVNLTGTFRMCQAAQRLLSVGDGASIVNIASTNGHIAVPNTVAYCVSKAGVIHLTRVLALEWATAGIRVNAVGPTIVATDMTSDVRADDRYMDDKLASIPLGRMAEPADVAGTVVYLVSPAASMVTGQTLFVDGGATIH